VVAIEQYKQNADGGWKQHKTIFGKCIRKEKPSAITHAKLVERLFVITV
jgi:hypothetical protein